MNIRGFPWFNAGCFLTSIYYEQGNTSAIAYSLHSLAAHPGVSITGIQHKGNPTVIQKMAIWLFGKIIAGIPEHAAQPLVIASLQGISGQFYGPTGFKQLKGKAGLVDADIKTKDTVYGEEILRQVFELTGLNILDVLSH